MKLMPGVRLNFNKDSVGMSFGVPGARYTINSKGRRTVTTGLPGTGIYNVETLSSGTRKSQAQPEEATTKAKETFVPYDPPKSMQPGLFAFKAERELYAYLRDVFQWDEQDTPDQAIEKAKVLREKFPTLKWSLFLLQMLSFHCEKLTCKFHPMNYRKYDFCRVVPALRCGVPSNLHTF